jgi:hypothetical protein
MKKLISIAILAGALCAGTVQAQTGSTNRATVPWSDPSRPGLVRVSVISGSISVKTHSGKDVIVEGTSVGRRGRNQAPDKNAEGLTLISGPGRGFTVEENNNVLTVSSENWIDAGGNFEIQVPVKTNLNLSAVSGNVNVEGIEGEIEVSVVHGDVRFSNVSGAIVANAQSGNVFATVREVAGNKEMSFTGFNGNIDVTLPPSAKANLKLRTDHGEVWSGFDIKLGPGNPPLIENRPSGRGVSIQVDRTMNGTINGGGQNIELRTFNGNIYLRKAN